MEDKQKFSFGKNWKNFLKTEYDKKKLEGAIKSLQDFLGQISLEGKVFLDFGCGSGIHSLAALELGAKKVISIDVDIDSVECCEQLRDRVADQHKVNWEVKQGSLLDDEFIKNTEAVDFVYCWGVAHHTGDMWKALQNLVGLVEDKGYLFIAIYNDFDGHWSSAKWSKIKKCYVSHGPLVKKMMEYYFMSFNFLRMLLRFKNPIKKIRSYRKKRGMDWRTDIVDWIGGYPFEYATNQELFQFYHDQHNMELVNIKTTNYTGNNQLLFKKK